MKRGKIILVDGISNSGKTTLCNSLHEFNDFRIIPESIRLLEQRLEDVGDNILFVPKTIEQEKLNQELLFDLEFDKWYAASFFAQKGQNVVIDKSPYSIVATAFAFESKEIVGTYKNSVALLNQFRKKVERFDIVIPDISILLKADDISSKKRNSTRKHKLATIWTSESTRVKQEKVLERIFDSLNSKKIILNTSNMDAEKTYKKTINIINDDR